MEPLQITILMNVLDSDVYIEESIGSVLNQTFSNFELVIMDYRLIDNSINILKKYTDNRIKIINNNKSSSSNTDFSFMTGEYIAYLGANDIMLPHRLRKQYEFMEENQDIDILGSWMYNFGDYYGAVRRPITHVDVERSALLENPMHLSTVMIRKKSLLRFKMPQGCEIFQFNHRYMDDYKLWMYFLIQDFKFANIPTILLKHRVCKNTTHIEITTLNDDIELDYINFITRKIIANDSSFLSVLDIIAQLYKNKKLRLNDYKCIVSNLYNNY